MMLYHANVLTPPPQVLANTAIEEVIHLLSPVKTLRVMLIGPDWKRIAPGPSCTTHDKEVCPPCTRIHAKRILSIYRYTTVLDTRGQGAWDAVHCRRLAHSRSFCGKLLS
jgi:hypothetical protein